MPRHKDANWDLPADGNTWQHVEIAILMDIRDELQEVRRNLYSINSILGCRNFLSLPRKVDAIRKNTERKRRKPKAKP